MNPPAHVAAPDAPVIPNGSGAAAILAAGIGSFALAVIALAADKSALVRNSLVLYKPTGPLSGVTTAAIFVWLLIWGLLNRRWGGKTVGPGRVTVAAFVLLGLGFLLTFPPIGDPF